jgi:hypothetical protein
MDLIYDETHVPRTRCTNSAGRPEQAAGVAIAAAAGSASPVRLPYITGQHKKGIVLPG